MAIVGLLHTSPVHVATFESLVGDIGATVLAGPRVAVERLLAT